MAQARWTLLLLATVAPAVVAGQALHAGMRHPT